MRKFYLLILLIVTPVVWFTNTSFKFVNRPGEHSEQTQFEKVSKGIDVTLPFIWPTDASRIVTNEFGAFRKTHFHEGIDISTNRRDGYKVFAVMNGYVSRIRVSPNGYGRQLTMKHLDGTGASFSHLSGFNARIQKYVKQQQKKAGGFEIDVNPDSGALYFNQGEVVAYTGESGAGPPHLHFEVYDDQMNPVNPLLMEAYKFEESTPPIIGKMLVLPMSHQAHIDGSRKSKTISTKKRSASSYIVTQPIHIGGDVGFALYTQDVPDAERRLTGVYDLKLFIDDSLVYEARYDSLLHNGAKMIALHYDYPRMKRVGAKFQKLFYEQGNRLPLYHRSATDGIIRAEQLEPGEHDFRIISADLDGNAATLTGTIISNHVPEISTVEMKGKNATFSLTHQNLVSDILVSSKTLYGSWKTKSVPLTSLTHENRFAQSELSLPVSRTDGDILRLVAKNKLGTNSPPQFIYFKKPVLSSPTIKITEELFGTEVTFTVTANGAFTSTPSLGVREGKTDINVPLYAVDMNEYEGSYTPSSTFVGTRFVEVKAEVGGTQTQGKDTFTLLPIDPMAKGEINSSDGMMSIAFERGSVFKTLFMSYEEKNNNEFRTYALSPDDEMMDRGVTVSLTYPKLMNTQYLGFFYSDEGSWQFIPSRMDAEHHTLTARLARTLGSVALMQDSTPPTIGHFKIKGGAQPRVSYTVHDGFSGVSLDDAKLYVDGDLIIPEVSEGGLYTAVLTDLAKGKHELKLVVKDRVGNVTVEEQGFKVQ